jgi:hypothetical protein
MVQLTDLVFPCVCFSFVRPTFVYTPSKVTQ